MSTIVSPFQRMTSLGASVTRATAVASMFSQVGKRGERRHVLRREHHRHALLRLRNGELSAVESLVLARHAIEINLQTVRKFADGDG